MHHIVGILNSDAHKLEMGLTILYLVGRSKVGMVFEIVVKYPRFPVWDLHRLRVEK